jgi:hypothetical protein
VLNGKIRAVAADSVRVRKLIQIVGKFSEKTPRILVE